MPVRDARIPRRFSLTLDPALVIERAILQRLNDLSTQRAKDWLRSLLVEGFLAEGHWLHAEAAVRQASSALPADTIPATPFSRWCHASRLKQPPVSGSSSTGVSLFVATTQRAVAPSHASPAVSKPFAHLRKVIG